jgi:hypothetical protein
MLNADFPLFFHTGIPVDGKRNSTFHSPLKGSGMEYSACWKDNSQTTSRSLSFIGFTAGGVGTVQTNGMCSPYRTVEALVRGIGAEQLGKICPHGYLLIILEKIGFASSVAFPTAPMTSHFRFTNL